jgi:Dna[CI] antecedent, DciA
MERIGGAVSRELGRFGPVSELAPLVEAWPTAVGPEISCNAWPARLARDGTLHVHARDSIWAFELTSRAQEIRSRLGDLAPLRLMFIPGPVPEPPLEALAAARERSPEPSAKDVARAASFARGIRDEELRKVVAKAAAASLARLPSDRSFW